MHIPKHFKITEQKEIHAFIKSNAFGQLISTVDGRPFSTHLPFIFLENEGVLLGHLGRMNEQLTSLDGQEVLITLQGPHDYISPSWYAKPGVPTWNYQAVHIYGKCRTFDEPERLKHIVETLTRTYESGYAEPWKPDYNPAMLKAIIGIEIVISEIQCQYKLSQNRGKEDQQRVIATLKTKGKHSLATAMENALSK